jgi:uncharacterized protein
MRNLMAALSGLVFGLGVVISGMGDPAKVLNFFDVIGTWDPSLGLVMGSALGVTMLGYRLVLRRERPVFAEAFTLPTVRDIDARLIGGSAVFGIGWGLSGFCPGGSIPMLGSFSAPVFVFTAAMLIGIFTARTMQVLAMLRRSQPGKA